MGQASGFFQDKIAFVTGGGSGLGRALCEELARRGATSVVTDIDGDSAARISGEICAAGGRSWAMELDVSQAQSVARCIQTVIGKHGRLDYIFNNAGIIILGEVRDMDLEHWHRIIGVNLLGVLYGTVSAYSHMVKQGYGHIVNIASAAGLTPLPTYTAYSTTKHGVVGLSNSLRAEAAQLGVKVTVVCPGSMETGMGNAATILHAKREDLPVSKWNQNAMLPALAAQRILLGIERNQAIIVFPLSARILWWVYRMRPGFLAKFESKILANFRSARTGLP